MGGGRSRNQGLVGDPYLNQYGNNYGYPATGGLGGYGPPVYTITTAPALIEEPWAVTQWTEYYVPTVRAGAKRPVIYVAAPLPAASPCGGFGGLGGLGGGFPATGFGGGFPATGFGGGFPATGFGGGFPATGFGGGFPATGLGGGFPATGFGGGLGGGFPATGLGGLGGGYGANLGYQALPMMTVAYGGGIPGVPAPFGGLGGGLGGGLPLY